jgi:hypothetical protein
MAEQVTVRDFNDTRTKGYLILSQQLGAIRSLCLQCKSPQMPSAAKAVTTLQTIRALLHDFDYAAHQFAPVFSPSEQQQIHAYVQHIQQQIGPEILTDPAALTSVWKTIYDDSTELKASFGVFRVTFEIAVS